MSVRPDIASASLCVQAQLFLVEYLNSRDSLLRGTRRVPVLGRRKTNIADDIDAAIAELGACVYVLPMLPVKFNTNVPGPMIDQAEFRIRCIENDALNTELPDVYELIEAIVRDVHGLRVKPLAQFSCLALADRPVEQQPDDRLIFDVIFNARGTYPPRFEHA